MTSVVLVDTSGTVVEYVTAEDDLQQSEDVEYEINMEQEGEVEGECEAEEVCEEGEADECPAVAVEELPGVVATEERGYLAQVWMCGDEAYLMQEVETEGAGDHFQRWITLRGCLNTICPERTSRTSY